MASGPTQPHVITGREKKTRSSWSVTTQTKMVYASHGNALAGETSNRYPVYETTK